MSRERVLWKLFETPAAGQAPPSFVAEADGRVVGQYAGSPTRFLVGDRQLVGLHGCDVMTAAAFRRRGILTALGTRAHEAWRRAGLVFVTGLSSGAWGSRSAALSWEALFPFRWLVAAVEPQAVLVRRFGLPSAPGLALVGSGWRALWDLVSATDASVAVEEVAEAGEEIDDLWRSVRPECQLSVVRDRAWVDWRYVRAPGGRYRILFATRAGRPKGYLVTARDGPGRGLIAELFTARGDEGARAALLRHGCRRLRDEGAEVVSALAVPGSPMWRSCRRAGFFPRKAFDFEVVRLDPALKRSDLSRPDRWTLAGGDFDVV